MAMVLNRQRNLLYAGAALSAFTVFKHTEVCINDIFPQLDNAIGPTHPLAFSTKCNYLQTSIAFASMGKRCSSLARHITVTNRRTALKL
jgi:hypothetical protein